MGTITRYRGDTAPDKFTIKQDSVAVNLTSCTFLLTVNSQENPTDASHQLLQMVGSVTSAVDGFVEFAPDATQADQEPGSYFYDVQMTDAAGKIRTVDKGRYRFKQDITKS